MKVKDPKTLPRDLNKLADERTKPQTGTFETYFDKLYEQMDELTVFAPDSAKTRTSEQSESSLQVAMQMRLGVLEEKIDLIINLLKLIGSNVIKELPNER